MCRKLCGVAYKRLLHYFGLQANMAQISEGGCAMFLVFGAGCLLLSLLFHAASLLHLGLPLLYALFVPTLFSGWYYSHYALANGIWYVLIALGLISWAVSLVRKIIRAI